MATTNTLKAIVTYYERVSRDAGIKPQEVKASAKRIADGTKLMPNTVNAALKEEELGFIKTEEGKWKIGKVYDWVDFKKTFDANLPEVTKFIVWRQFPDVSSAPVGIKPDSSEVEVKKCTKPHYDKWVTDTIDKCLTKKFNDDTRGNVLTTERANLLAQAIKDNNLEVGPIVVQYGLAMVKESNA